MRKWIYGAGCPEGNEDIYITQFEAHNNEVMRYFKDRPEDLLVMDLAKDDGWETLCAFLGKSVPDIAFPYANKARDRERKNAANALSAKRLKRFIKRMKRANV